MQHILDIYILVQFSSFYLAAIFSKTFYQVVIIKKDYIEKSCKHERILWRRQHNSLTNKLCRFV